jgi:hypothetical protein
MLLNHVSSSALKMTKLYLDRLNKTRENETLDV